MKQAVAIVVAGALVALVVYFSLPKYEFIPMSQFLLIKANPRTGKAWSSRRGEQWIELDPPEFDPDAFLAQQNEPTNNPKKKSPRFRGIPVTDEPVEKPVRRIRFLDEPTNAVQKGHLVPLD